MSDQLTIALITALATGGISSIGTVVALRVHVNYLRENIERLHVSVARAHSRIDKIGTGGH